MSSDSRKKKFQARLRTAWANSSPMVESLLHVAHVAKGAGITPFDNSLA